MSQKIKQRNIKRVKECKKEIKGKIYAAPGKKMSHILYVKKEMLNIELG